MGQVHLALARMRQLRRDSWSEILASGPMLDDAPPDFPYRSRVTNAVEVREAVRDLQRLGADFIEAHDQRFQGCKTTKISIFGSMISPGA